MQLGITVDMSGPHPKLDIERILEAERLGFTQVWIGEAYSTDAVSPVAWILARTTRLKAGTGIMQIPARTPACAAMTVMSLQASLRQPVPVRRGRVRCPGGGRLARRAVRQADDAHQGIHRHHQADPGAQGAAGVPRRGIRSSPMPARMPPAWASRCAASRMAIRRCRSTSPRSPRPACAPPASAPTACCRSSIRRSSRRSYRRRSWTG